MPRFTFRNIVCLPSAGDGGRAGIVAGRRFLGQSLEADLPEKAATENRLDHRCCPTTT